MKIDSNKPIVNHSAELLDRKAKSVSEHTQAKSRTVAKTPHQSTHEQKVSLDNSASNVYRLQQIAHKFGLDKAVVNDKPLNIEQRANRRERLKAAQKQQNLESIFEFATEYVDNSKTNEEVDLDWLYQFFEAAESIYSRPMQQLWGKILAMQTAKPGRFSLRSLILLKKMTFREATMFQQACALLCKDKQEFGGKIITGVYRQPKLFDWFSRAKAKSLNLSKFGLNYPDLLSLIELGLVYSSEIESSPLPAGQTLLLENMKHKLSLAVQQNNSVLTYYKLTQTGAELASLIATDAKKEYFQQLAQLLSPAIELTELSTDI